MISEEQLVLRLKAHGVRATAMRLLVLSTLSDAHTTLSLRDLEDALHPADKSTIFRTLSLFEAHHLVHAIDDGTGTTRYEACMSDDDHHDADDRHAHFHCMHCGKTFCLTDIAMPEPALPDKYVALSVNYVITGYCPDCAKKHPI